MSLLLPIMFLIEQNLQELSWKENEGEEKEKQHIFMKTLYS